MKWLLTYILGMSCSGVKVVCVCFTSRPVKVVIRGGQTQFNCSAADQYSLQSIKHMHASNIALSFKLLETLIIHIGLLFQHHFPLF